MLSGGGADNRVKGGLGLVVGVEQERAALGAPGNSVIRTPERAGFSSKPTRHSPLSLRAAKMRLMLAYAFTIFTGAFLLFQVQPLIGKFVLPWFGGGPGVWTTCMLFFQTLLLGGYAYAHLTSRQLKPRAQIIVHLALLAGALALLPITPSAAWKPQGGANPTLQILLLLAATLGLPYFVLSSTGPLLQQWFSRSRPGVSPYRLYALSNVGSLLALVSYPFFFETHFTRKAQAGIWGWGLVIYVIGSAFCAVEYWKTARQPNTSPSSPQAPPSGEATGERTFLSTATRDSASASNSGTSNDDPGPQRTGMSALRPPMEAQPASQGTAPVTLLQRLLWLLLPACASVLLLATTNKLCLDVAVVPFLWIAPLALYLLSFVICFDNPRWYVRFPYALVLAAALAGVCWALFSGSDWKLWKQISMYCGGLFICCLVCHGELYRLRPAPSRLTEFYLLIAAGGALGGLFVAVIAPLLFTNYYELHAGLLLCGLLFAMVLTTLRTRLLPFKRDAVTPVFAGSSRGAGATGGRVTDPGAKAEPPLTLAAIPDPPVPSPRDAWLEFAVTAEPTPLALPARWIFGRANPDAVRIVFHRVACTIAWLCVAALATTLWLQTRKRQDESISASRNFYGVLTVFEHRRDEPKARYYLLMHGRITHGLQFADPEQATWPTTYYGPASGVGLALNALPAGQRRIGLVGLGTGTLTSYGRPGDYIRIYDINPEVKRLATSRFTYVSNCQAKVEITLGDARLSMEREAPQNFDLLALDAFSSDAIPVHLLTKEAFELYGRHLNINGVIAVHISNHFLDLEPVVMNLARQFNFKAALIDYDEINSHWWLYASTWILLTRNQALLDSPPIADAAGIIHTNAPKVPLWTDDFTSLYQILK
jgi:spermidine synthase